MKKIFVLFSLVLIMVFSAAAQQLPKTTGLLVNDFANIIDDELQMSMETKLRDFEKKTSMEIAVVTVDSLGGVSIEEYANKLFHEWGIGKKEADNGVLFMVSMQERKMRIETGYGAEGFLPDAICKRITGTMVVPRFKEGAYGAGILSGVEGILENLQKALDRERAVPVSAPVAKGKDSKIPMSVFIGLILAIVVISGGFIWSAYKKNKETREREEREALRRARKAEKEERERLSHMAGAFVVGLAGARALHRDPPPSRQSKDDEERRLKEAEEEEERRRKKRRQEEERQSRRDDDDHHSSFDFGGSHDIGGHDDGGGFDFGGGDSGGGGASDSW